MTEGRERKRTWREIDQAKDKSYHRREERPGTVPEKGSRSNKAYKAELDRFFNAGQASLRIKTLMKETTKDLPLTAEESPERIKLVRKVRSAETFDEFVTAVNELRGQFGLPRDVDILSRVLEHPNQQVVRESLKLLKELANRLSLLQLRAIEVRLDALELSTDDPETLSDLDELRNLI
ncbi:MAG: hypothetical protein JW797_11285 [Bradymonadales bacterium]|nr:hypothetical protein [Bradymonadales bacterium]